MYKVLISPYSRPLRNGKDNPKNYPYWQEVIDKLKQKGVYIIQIGRADEKRFENVDEFLINKSLKDISNLLNEVIWVGVDNFLPHLANLVNRPGIVLWGQSDPNIFGHALNENLLKDRKYVRPFQFATWEEVEYISEVFVDASCVVEAVVRRLNG